MRVFLAVTTLVMVAAAGCLADGGAEDDRDGPVLAADAPLAAYLHDLSAPIEGLVTLTEHFRTPVPGPGGEESIELDTWVIRPEVPDPVPLVLEVTPYYAGGEPPSLGRLGTELIARGYAVGVSSVRGTGMSGGCFTQGGPREAEDTAEVIQHLSALDWANGSVGLIGVSYPGTTPQDVWVEAPPALKTIVPISGISDLYKYNFVNGVHINVQGFGFNTYYWALVGAPPFPLGVGGDLAAIPPEHVATAVAGEACADQVDVQEGGVSSTLDGNKDAYWQVRDFHKELRDSWDLNAQRASVFYIHGLQDWNVKPHNMEDWLPAIQESGVPYKVWLGQWGHAWPQSTSTQAECLFDEEDDRGASCRADWWNLTLVAWFDQFLKGVDTGILDAPPAQVQDDLGVWRHETAWPPLDVAWHRFHPDESGDLAPEPGSGAASYFDQLGGVTGSLPVALPLPGSEAPDRVVFRSEPLASDWHISGLPVFHGNVTASGSRASLILTLAEELRGGTLRPFNFAAQSLNHVQSLESGTADVSGLTQEVEVRFFPQDDVVLAGNRLVLVAAGNIVGGPGPSLQPVADGSEITLHLDGAWLDIPVDHSIIVETPQPYVNAA